MFNKLLFCKNFKSWMLGLISATLWNWEIHIFCIIIAKNIFKDTFSLVHKYFRFTLEFCNTNFFKITVNKNQMNKYQELLMVLVMQNWMSSSSHQGCILVIMNALFQKCVNHILGCLYLCIRERNKDEQFYLYVSPHILKIISRYAENCQIFRNM